MIEPHSESTPRADRSTSDDQTSSGLGHLAAPLLWVVAGGFVCSQMISLEPSLLEEGYIVHIAQRMVSGDVLYRDIVTFTGPLPFELLALLFRVFGEQIEVARWAVTLLQALACGAVFALARKASPGWPAHAAACALACAPVLLFPLYSMYFYSTLAGSLVYIAGFAAMRGLRSAPWALTAGALVAGIALTKQTVGVVFALGLFLVLLAASRSARAENGHRIPVAFAMGGLGVAALTTFIYALSGDLDAIFRSLVVLPLSLRETFDAPYINLWPPGSLSPEILGKRSFYLPYLYTLLTKDFEEPGRLIVLLAQFLFVVPFIAAGLTVLAAFRRRLSSAVWIQTAVFVGVGANLFPRTDWGHLVFVLPASIVQLMVLMGPLRETRGVLRFVATFVPAGLMIVLLFGAWTQSALLHRVTEQGSWGPHVKQRPINRSLRGDQIPLVIRYIRGRTEPGEAIFVARAEPLIYFATDTTNPTPYGGVIPGLHAEQQAAILEGLSGVRFVVMSEIDQPFFTYYRDELPRVEAYFERYFEVARPFTAKPTWLIVMKRGKDRGPTAIDLMSPDVVARAFLRDETGTFDAESSELPKFPNHHNRRPHPFALGAWGGGLDYEFVVPAGARLQMSVGVDELVGLRHGWDQPPDSEIVVSISLGEGFEELSRTRILDSERTARRWLPLDLDLSDWGGRAITLRLELRSDVEIADDMLGWFGSPRIALPAPDEEGGDRAGP